MISVRFAPYGGGSLLSAMPSLCLKMVVTSKRSTDMQQVDHDALVQAMVGRDLGDIYGWQSRRSYGDGAPAACML